MISWNVPKIEYPEEPKMPNILLWILISGIVAASVFFIGVSLSTNDYLDPSWDNIKLILLFSIIPMFFVVLIRLLVHFIILFKYQSICEELNNCFYQWTVWAEKNVILLTSSRVSEIDEQNKNIILSKLTPNKNNQLLPELLKSRPLWEKSEEITKALLTPISKYYQEHHLSTSINILWHVNTENKDVIEIDWTQVIQEQAANLAFKIAKVEPLPQTHLTKWLSTLYDEALTDELYIVLSIQFDANNASEEACCLLLSSSSFPELKEISRYSKLLRPIVCDTGSLSEALETQSELQFKGKNAQALWCCDLNEKNKEEVIINFIKQNTDFSLERIFDTEMILGNAGIARYAMAISLSSLDLPNRLLVSQLGSKLYFQWISPK